MAKPFCLHTKHAHAVALLLAAAGYSCGGDDAAPAAAQCLPEPTAACSPDINTNFESIYGNLLSKRCGSTGTACHGREAHMGNLVLADADSAYKALLGEDGTHARVVAGDPDCSPLMQRLESDDPNFRMPWKDAKLGEGSRCAVRMWIESGAAR
jgi:hypothetical protein